MSIHYLLDTNIVSYLMNGKCPVVQTRISAVGLDSCGVSAITEAELWHGVERKNKNIRLRIAVRALLQQLSSLPWDADVARIYGSLRASQERQGKILSSEDMMIAAHALTLDLTLITHDAAFAQVDGLRWEDWTDTE